MEQLAKKYRTEGSLRAQQCQEFMMNRGPSGYRTFQFYYQRHLDSALSCSKTSFYKKYREKWESRHKDLPYECLENLESGLINNVAILPWIEDTIKNLSRSMSSDYKGFKNFLLDVVKESLQIQHDAMTHSLHNPDSLRLNQYVELLKYDPEVNQAYNWKVFILSIHSQLEREAESKRLFFTISNLPGFEFHGDLVYLTQFPGHPIVVPYHFLLSILDKIESHLTYSIYLTMVNASPSRQGLEFRKFIQDVHKILDKCYRKHGNEATFIMKGLDPLGLGTILSSLEYTHNDHDFLASFLADFYTDHPKLSSDLDDLTEIYSAYLKRHGERAFDSILESYGQEKAHYFPIVDEEAGRLKMYRYGTAYRHCNITSANQIGGDFKREVVCAFFKKEGRLPDIYQDITLPDSIKEIYNRGVPGNAEYCARIPWRDWDQIVFKPVFPFNYFPNALELLDDKAITPHRPFIHQLFARDALDIMNLAYVRSPKHTKLILEILSRPEINIKEFYETVESLGYIPSHWAVIQLKAKERELKIDARAFSILTLECRMMASACERNLASHILSLFSEQSMTKSGSELRHTIETMISTKDTDTHHWISLVLDIEQWNYTFRAVLQESVISTLNQLFGVDHFSIIPMIFNQAIFISADSYVPPGMNDIFSYWEDHAGGNQGIAQKLWTIITILIIKQVMTKSGNEYRLTGAGDNQVLKVKMSIEEIENGGLINLKASLATAFESVGLGLKKSETWYSNRLFNYQRKYYKDGHPVQNGLKQALRAFAGSSDINGGINTTIMTAMNGGVGIISNTSDPWIGPIFALFEGLVCICVNPSYNKALLVTKKILVCLTFVTSELGYLPFMQLTGFSYSGHQDQLTESLALLKWIWVHKPEYRDTLNSLLNITSGKVDMESQAQLVLSPYSLNIKKPPTPESYIKSLVEKFLMSSENVRNIQLRAMFKTFVPAEQHRVINQMYNIRPIDIKILHTMFSNSACGAVNSHIGKFNRLSSIIKGVERKRRIEDQDSVSKEIRKRDLDTLYYIVRKLKLRHPYHTSFEEQLLKSEYFKYVEFCNMHHFMTGCTYSLRLFLISWTYGFLPERILGPYTPAPLEQVVFHESKPLNDQGNTLIITPAYNIPPLLEELETSKGPYHLLIGSNTHNPIKVIKLTSVAEHTTVRAITENMRVFSWLRILNSSQHLIDYVFNELDKLAPGLSPLINQLTPGISGGTYEHRMTTEGSSVGAGVSSDSHVSTWYSITSNKAIALNRGGEDKYIFFQQLYQYIVTVLRQVRPKNHTIYAEVRLDHCSYNTVTPSFQLDTPLILDKVAVTQSISLNKDQVQSIVKEAEYQILLDQNSIINTLDGPGLLSAHSAYVLGKLAKQYSTGVTSHAFEHNSDTLPQTSLNISVIRLIDIGVLFRSLLIQLIIAGHFGYSSSPGAILKKLSNFISLGYIPQAIHPLKDFISSIITASREKDVIHYGRCTWAWSGGQSTVSLLPVVYHCLLEAAKEITQFREETIIVIESKGSSKMVERVSYILRRWFPKYRRLSAINRNASWENLINLSNRSSTSLKVVLTTDAGAVLERGRTKCASGLLDVNVKSKKSSTICKLAHKTLPCRLVLFNIPLQKHSHPKIEHHLISYQDTINTSMKCFPTSLHRVLKWDNISSGAKFKLLSILSNYNIMVMPQNIILALADGTGSYSSIMLHLYPEARLIFNTLIKQEELPIAMHGIYTPPELICQCEVLDRCLNVPCHFSQFGDLSSLRTWEEIKKTLPDDGSTIDLLTFDMEDTSQTRIMAITLMKDFIIEYHIKTLVIKCFIGDLQTYIVDIVQGVVDLYQKVSISKPFNSSWRSEEIYIVCQERMTSQNPHTYWDLNSVYHGFNGQLTSVIKNPPLRDIVEHIDWCAQLMPCRSYKLDIEVGKDLQQFGLITLYTMIINLIDSTWSDPSSKPAELERPLQLLVRSRTLASEIFNIELELIINVVLLFWKHVNPMGLFSTNIEIEVRMMNQLSEILFHLESNSRFSLGANINPKIGKFLGYIIYSSKYYDHHQLLYYSKLLLEIFPYLAPRMSLTGCITQLMETLRLAVNQYKAIPFHYKWIDRINIPTILEIRKISSYLSNRYNINMCSLLSDIPQLIPVLSLCFPYQSFDGINAEQVFIQFLSTFDHEEILRSRPKVIIDSQSGHSVWSTKGYSQINDISLEGVDDSCVWNVYVMSKVCHPLHFSHKFTGVSDLS